MDRLLRAISTHELYRLQGEVYALGEYTSIIDTLISECTDK